MILPSIETPADLQGLSYEELNQLSAEIREFIISTVTDHWRSPWFQSWRRRTHSRVAPGLRIPQGHPVVGHRPPGVRPQAAHRPTLRLQESAPAGRPLGLPQPLGERTRLDRVLARVHGALVRARTLGGARTAQGARWDVAGNVTSSPSSATARSPAAWRTRRSTTSVPLEPARRHRPQRQRPQLRPDHLQALGFAHALASRTRRTSRCASDFAGWCRDCPASARPPIWGSTASPRSFARWSRPTRSSRTSACATSDPSTDTTSSRWRRP